MAYKLQRTISKGKNLTKHRRLIRKYAKCEAYMYRNWWNAKHFMVYSGRVHTYAWRNREGHHARRLTSLKRMVKRRLKNMRQWSNRLVSSYKKMGRIQKNKETELCSVPEPREISKQIKEQVEMLKSGRRVFLNMGEPGIQTTPSKSSVQDKAHIGIEEQSSLTSNCTNAEKPEESWRAGGSKFLDMLIRKLGAKTIAHEAIISSETSPSAQPVISKDFVGYVQLPGMMLTPLVPENCKTLDKNSAFVSDSLDAYMQEHYASQPELDPTFQEDKEKLPQKLQELQEQEKRSLNFGFTKPEVGKHTDRLVAKTKTNQQRRLIYELRRLNATIVDAAALSAHADISCTKDFCKLGCVCSSLAGSVPVRSHCGKADCVLECHCQGADQAGVMLVEADTGHGITTKEAFHLRQKATARLAKMEREFTSTLVILDNEVVLVNESQAAKKRRCTMAPKRYKDFEDIDLFMEEDEVPRSSQRRGCAMTPKRYKESDDIDEEEYEVPRFSKRQKKMGVASAGATAASARISSPVPNERCTVGNTDGAQLKHCEVGLRRLKDIGNLATFSMSHQVAHRPPAVADSNPDQANRAEYSIQRQSKELSAKKKGEDKQHKTQAGNKPKNASESENTEPDRAETETESVPKDAVEPSSSCFRDDFPKESSIDLDTISIYFSSRPHMCRRAVSVPKNSYKRLNQRSVERVLQNAVRQETSETKKLLQRYVMDVNTNNRREIDKPRERERGSNTTPERGNSDGSEVHSLLLERNATKPTERQEPSSPLRFQVEEQATLETRELVPQESLEPKELLQSVITDEIIDHREEIDMQRERERGNNTTPERENSDGSEVHTLLLESNAAKPTERQEPSSPLQSQVEEQATLETRELDLQKSLEPKELLQSVITDDIVDYREEIDMQQERERGNNKTPERDDPEESEVHSLLLNRSPSKPTEHQNPRKRMLLEGENQASLESEALVQQESLETKELLQSNITDDNTDYRREKRDQGNKSPAQQLQAEEQEPLEVQALVQRDQGNKSPAQQLQAEEQEPLEVQALVQRDQGNKSPAQQLQAEEQEPLEVQESLKPREQLQRKEIAGQRKQENSNNVPVIETRNDSNETLSRSLPLKRSLAKPSEEQKASKHLKLQEEEHALEPGNSQSDVQVPTSAACYSPNPASADVLVERSVEVSSESNLANIRSLHNEAVKDTDTRVKFIPAPKKGNICFVNWKNFRDAFESGYIFLWTVQMQTHNFLAATTANQTPSISEAISVVNARFARDQGTLPLMAVQLMEGLQNITSNRMIAMEGRQGYWLIKNVPQTPKVLTKDINIVVNRVKQKRQSELQLQQSLEPKPQEHHQELQAAGEGGSSEPEPQAQEDTPATASSSTQDLLTNIEFRPLSQDDVDELQIPEQHSSDHHWMVLDFYDDFSHIFVPESGDMISVPRIHTFMQMARESQKVVKLQLFPRSPYDAFVTPFCKRKIYFGPLPLDMPLPLILLIQMVDGKLMTREVYQKEYSVPVQRHRRSMAFKVLHVNGRVSYERDSDSAAKLEATPALPEIQISSRQSREMAREEDSLEEPCQSQANPLDTDKQLEDSLSVSEIKKKLSRMNFTLTEAVDSPPSLPEDVTPCQPSGDFTPGTAEVSAKDAEPATNSLQSLTQLTQSLPTILSDTSSSFAALRLPAKNSRLSMPLAKINESLKELLSTGKTVTPGDITITKFDDQKGVQNDPSGSKSPAPKALPVPVIPAASVSNKLAIPKAYLGRKSPAPNALPAPAIPAASVSNKPAIPMAYLGRKPWQPKLEVKTPNGVKTFPVSLIFLLKNPTMPFSKVREPLQPPLVGLKINSRPNIPAQSQTMPGNANEKVRAEPPSQSLPSSKALSAPLQSLALKVSDQPAPSVRSDQAAASCPKPTASVANEAVKAGSSNRAVSGIVKQTVQNAFHPAPMLTAGSGASPMTIPPFQPPPVRAAVSAGWPGEVVKIYARPNMPVNRQSMPGNANRIVRAPPPPRPSVPTKPIAATPVSTTKLPVAGEASSHLAMPVRAPSSASAAGQQARKKQTYSGFISATGLPLYPARVLGSDIVVEVPGIIPLRFKSIFDTGCFLNRHLSKNPEFKSRVPAEWNFMPLKQQDPSSIEQ